MTAMGSSTWNEAWTLTSPDRKLNVCMMLDAERRLFLIAL